MTDQTPERYGPKVRWLRTGQRMTGRELCRRVGITPSYLSDIEVGRRLPSPAVSDRLADELGIARDALWRLALLERLSERDLRTLLREAAAQPAPLDERRLTERLLRAAQLNREPISIESEYEAGLLARWLLGDSDD